MVAKKDKNDCKYTLACDYKFDYIHKDLEYLKSKTNDINSEIKDIGKILAINTESLKQHMRRTDLLERKVNISEKLLYTGLGIFLIIQLLISILPYFIK